MGKKKPPGKKKQRNSYLRFPKQNLFFKTKKKNPLEKKRRPFWVKNIVLEKIMLAPLKKTGF